MFLPVLLVRDYGVWGFVVFAVPNVIGAGAVGWGLRNGASERIVETHRVACRVFSLVTVAFHCYFLLWVIGKQTPSTGPLPWEVIAGCGTVVGIAVLLSWLASRDRPRLWSAGLVWALSGGLFAGFLVMRRHFGVEGAPTLIGLRGAMHDPAGLIWLGPVCVFGFALCPYLDSTFCRARQSVDRRGGVLAFTIGFGVLFAMMILFTLAYAPNVLSGYVYSVVAIANIAVVLQYLCQSSFSVLVHSGEVVRGAPATSLLGRTGLICACVIGVLVGLKVLRPSPNLVPIGSATMTNGEVVYRCFMSFYGLVFPAYVWLCMIPTRDGHSGVGGTRGRRKLMVLVGACVLAGPCYWMGFIERVEWWLAPGLGMVLVARLLVRGRGIAASPARAGEVVEALRDRRG